MGPHLPDRKRGRTVASVLALGASTALLAGCSDDTAFGRMGMPEPGSEQGEHVLNLWQGAWLAAWITGIVVWGLIFWVIWRYRRRRADDIPVQTRYNLPLEILYTIAPVLMVIVFFSHTVKTQNAVLDDDLPVDNTIEVVGYQWSWAFNYGLGDRDDAADEDANDDEFAYGDYVWENGSASYIPTLVLPVGETTRFNLHSPDVIHDFGVPGFLMKMDVVPGRVNHYEITPTEVGTYKGKCYELCGVSHSRMLFNVEVVERSEYDAYLEELEAKGQESEAPLLGNDFTRTQAGLEGDAE